MDIQDKEKDTQIEVEKDKGYAKLILKILRSDISFRYFYIRLRELLAIAKLNYDLDLSLS